MYRGFGFTGGWGGFGGMGIFGGVMMIFFVLLIVLVIFGAARMGRWRTGGGCCSPVAHDGHDSHSALDIARERYAKGEISDEEFQKIKKDLS